MATFTATILAMCRDGEDIGARPLALLGVLAKAKRAEERTVRAVAEALNIPKPSVSRAADSLEEARLAVRTPDPDDRRSVFLEITPDGIAFVKRVNAGWTE